MDETTTTEPAAAPVYCACSVVRCPIGATECPQCRKPFLPAPPRSPVERAPLVGRR